MKTASRNGIAAPWRVGMRSFFLALLVALSVTAETSPGSAQPTGTDAPAMPTQGEETFIVDWDITAQRQQHDILRSYPNHQMAPDHHPWRRRRPQEVLGIPPNHSV